MIQYILFSLGLMASLILVYTLYKIVRLKNKTAFAKFLLLVGLSLLISSLLTTLVNCNLIFGCLKHATLIKYSWTLRLFAPITAIFYSIFILTILKNEKV